MSTVLWLIVGIAVAIALLGIVFALRLKRKEWKHETDYKAFFWMGLVWVLFGVPYTIIFEYTMNFFLIMGIVFLAIGAANRDKWDSKTRLTAEQKKIRMIAIAAGVVALAIGALAFFLFYMLR